MNEPARTVRKLNLGGMKPTGVSHKSPKDEVAAVAESEGFTSREPQKPKTESKKPEAVNAAPVEIAPEAPAPVVRRRRGPRRKKRDQAFNTRLKADSLQYIIDRCDELECGYADLLESWIEVDKKRRKN